MQAHIHIHTEKGRDEGCWVGRGREDLGAVGEEMNMIKTHCIKF